MEMEFKFNEISEKKAIRRKNKIDKKIENNLNELEEKKKLFEQLKNEENNPDENIDQIKINYESLKNEFDIMLKEVDSLGKLSPELEKKLRDKLSSIKEYINNYSYCLSNFYIKLFKDQTLVLDKDFQNIFKKYKKNKKFGFKKNNIVFNKAKNDNCELSTTNNNNENLQIKGIFNEKNLNLTLKQSDLDEIYKFENLENCNILVEGTCKVIYIKNIKNSNIKIGPTLNSVFVDYINDCNISIIGHQIRIHNSYDTTFNVFTTSKLVIEKCNKLKFKEYTYKYDNIDEDIRKSNFENKVNLWKEVQDFDWIKEEKSPHYDLIE